MTENNLFQLEHNGETYHFAESNKEYPWELSVGDTSWLEPKIMVTFTVNFNEAEKLRGIPWSFDRRRFILDAEDFAYEVNGFIKSISDDSSGYVTFEIQGDSVKRTY